MGILSNLLSTICLKFESAPSPSAYFIQMVKIDIISIPEQTVLVRWWRCKINHEPYNWVTLSYFYPINIAKCSVYSSETLSPINSSSFPSHAPDWYDSYEPQRRDRKPRGLLIDSANNSTARQWLQQAKCQNDRVMITQFKTSNLK